MLRITTIIAILLFSIGNLSAHPHMYIDASVRLLEKPSAITGLRLTWTFDLGFTSMVLESFDLDKNRRFDRNEVRAIEQEAFSYIVDKNWYTRIFINRRELSTLPQPQDFTAGINKAGTLYYEFTLPLNLPLGTGGQELWLYQYDQEFYVDIAYATEALTGYESAKHYTVKSLKLIPDRTAAYWEGTISPKRLTIEIKSRT